MDKTEFLAWVRSLPDDLEVTPFTLGDIQVDPERPEWGLPISGNYSARSTYKQQVHREYTIKIRCTTETVADFERTTWGDERWLNVKRTK